jgi:hypothetical protein
VTATIVFYVFAASHGTATASPGGVAEIGNADAGAKAETKRATPFGSPYGCGLAVCKITLPDKEQE